MGMVSLGPFAVPNTLFAALLAVLAFSILTYFAARLERRFDRWSTVVIVAGFAVARLVYVVLHWPAFAEDPWRILMVWQGGFQWVAGVVTACVVTFWLLKSTNSRLAGLAIVLLSTGIWLGGTVLLQDTRYDKTLPADMLLVDLTGATFDLQGYQEGPLVLNLWATWCPPCRRELPAMVKLARQRPDVPFLFVNQAEDAERVRAYLVSQNLPLEHVVLDPSSRAAQVFETIGLPMTLFFYDGRLKQVHAGEITPEVLEATIRALLLAGAS